jgi:hypothetical protein
MLEDDLAFPHFKAFHADMEATFEPPKCEFRARAEFLKVYQGKNDLHWYINRVRELVAMVTTSHIDEATRIVCFLQGLNDGPIKKHLFREYPDTLEKAISRALEEDFSAREAARARSFMGWGFSPLSQMIDRRVTLQELTLLKGLLDPNQWIFLLSQLRQPGRIRATCVATDVRKWDIFLMSAGHPNQCHALTPVQAKGMQLDVVNNQKTEQSTRCARPTGQEKNSLSTVELENPGPSVHSNTLLNSTETSVGLLTKLIVIELKVKGLHRTLRALVDTGASNNFVRSNVVKQLLRNIDSTAIDSKLMVKLTNVSILTVHKRSLLLSFSFDGLSGKDSFLLLDPDDRFDAILGMPWLAKYRPSID